jgi:hypothetical protein
VVWERSNSAYRCHRLWRLRAAVELWRSQLAQLRLKVADKSGALGKLGVLLRQDWLETVWLQQAYPGPEVFEITDTTFSPTFSPMNSDGFISVRSGRISMRRTSAWKWALEIASETLRDAIAAQALVAPDTIQAYEVAWQAALILLNHGSLYDKPIPVHQLGQRLSPDATVIRKFNRGYPAAPLRSALNEALATGKAEFHPPWPVADEEVSFKSAAFPGGTAQTAWVWDGFSNDQMRCRIKSIYENALIAYEAFVRLYFPALGRRLRLFASMPVEVHVDLAAQIVMPGLGPVGSVYYFPRAQANCVLIGTMDDQQSIETMQARNDEAKRRDRSLYRWAGYSEMSGALDVFGDTPITHLAHQWLKRDVEGLFK